MSARRLAAALAAAATLAAAAADAAEAGRAVRPPLASSRVLAERMRARGRATALIERRATDPLTGAAVTQRGRIALEPPDRARLDLDRTGESVTLRGDGGEWLQPPLGQMLRLRPEAAEAALRWWSLLLPGAERRFEERRLAPRVHAVVARHEDLGDTAFVTLDGAGLPSRLRFRDPAGETVEVRLSGWTFTRSRGRDAFVIVPPAGVTVVTLP